MVRKVKKTTQEHKKIVLESKKILVKNGQNGPSIRRLEGRKTRFTAGIQKKVKKSHFWPKKGQKNEKNVVGKWKKVEKSGARPN